MTMLQIIPFDRGAVTEPFPEWPAEDIVSGTRQHSGKILFEDKARGSPREFGNKARTKADGSTIR